jgi:hypothetical protein
MQTSLTPEGAGLQRPGAQRDALQLQTPDMAPEITSRAQVSSYPVLTRLTHVGIPTAGEE